MNLVLTLKKGRPILATAFCLFFILIGLLLIHTDQKAVTALLFITAFIIGGYQSAKEGLTDLVFNKHLSVDVLMILAAVGSGIIGYWLEGALLIFIFSLSSTLEELAMEKSKNAIATLMKMTPPTARKIELNGDITTLDTTDIRVGDFLQVRKGDTVPLDATLISGQSIFDESMITGEPLPAEKEAGDTIIGGTINQGPTVTVQVTAEKGDALFDKIIQMVQQAQESKSKTTTFIENMEDTYVKVVLIAVPLFNLFVHFVLGWDWLTSFYRSMILLTIASPCALVASSSPATLSAISRAARKGMIIKGGDIADRIANLDAIVFDKTGTLTKGKPEVVGAMYFGDEVIIKEVVQAVEKQSSHPIAQALLAYTAASSAISLEESYDLTGEGMIARYQGQEWKIGKSDFVTTSLMRALSTELQKDIHTAEGTGKTLVYVSQNDVLMAIFLVEDSLKPESKLLISQLKKMGITPILLTGDQEKTARYVANQIGIERVIANCLPTDKAAVIQELQKEFSYVGMVGDGVNDAPALAQANISYAMGSGTAIAMESADIVLMEDLTRIPYSVRLSKKMRTIIKQNIIFALSVITLLLISNLSQAINLPLGVIGHEGSTILVILNGLRLLYFK
ncbi:heavy metal translocating P-type ATPase [Streptococcus ruminantium]|uniref:Heavy metal translocating P-type ATPase n=1 Tax=Streptococcus ruminantium TaxID=1917441 RepID=A0ABU1B414_9STRE|nr:heavy metal translocating P-type ATPase [Streptococcus ruminantium]MDQ8759662.1 heavy metal translocating P-type ATPase [Streptococcus ruminantium]MDQ8767433.1 heavy metal translocating P-type ATPase [Streptococcus ruminantium]MDQ8768780.1 heavy metal translocating P-type ATPase [Streptococcus ruminantium]MDQ8774741.1 heavy metal translocating P-type ATPase [Streptococcus ruminantium]MDQ8781085.1 heavy metal translocating P-type ATPase [Streptococcus ruminantium]